MHVQFGCAHFFASDAIGASIQIVERCVKYSTSFVALEPFEIPFAKPGSIVEPGFVRDVSNKIMNFPRPPET